MNFLSHYYCLKEENPYILLGVIMPDLVKDFSKLYNKYIEDDYFPKDEVSILMLEGVAIHIKGDDAFHKHSIFKEIQEIAKAEINKIFSSTVKRKFVIAHVLIELMIDKYIMNINSGILKAFYSKIDKIDIEKVEKFYLNLNIEENKSHFIKNITKFKELKFLYRLKENEGIIFTLNKVFTKKLNYDFLDEKEKWNLVIEKIERKIEKQIPIILIEVKTKIYE